LLKFKKESLGDDFSIHHLYGSLTSSHLKENAATISVHLENSLKQV